MEEIRKRIREVESQILECRAIMAKSDERAAKCSKLSLLFADMYPDDLAEYQQANARNSELEIELAELQEELSRLEEEEMLNNRPEM